jgi:pimeloyl-ACP methyl ester carboxylesterase
MAQLFFTIDRLPGVAQMIGMPAPVPVGVLRSVVGGIYRSVAYANGAGVDPAVVERFVRFNQDRPLLRERIGYAKRMRADLAHPFDAEAITTPVHVIWGELDRLCPVEGADELRALLPDARMEVLPGVGHTPQIEATDTVVAAITDLAR